jgi:hypothetical protein
MQEMRKVPFLHFLHFPLPPRKVSAPHLLGLGPSQSANKIVAGLSSPLQSLLPFRRCITGQLLEHLNLAVDDVEAHSQRLNDALVPGAQAILLVR